MKLDSAVYDCALQHLIQKGDTDLFPYPFELSFLKECHIEIVKSLSNLDLSTYHPMSMVESLIPKTRFGFRIAHQPYPIDTLIYTALVLTIFDEVEQGRVPEGENRAFSYRKKPGLDPNIFQENRSFRHWLDHLKSFVFSNDYSHVIRTDISDFYQRIYRHRLENIISSLSSKPQIGKKNRKIFTRLARRTVFRHPSGK